VKIQDILLLYDYNYWANRRILDAAAPVEAERFVAETAHSFGSLQGTLVHTFEAEFGWRMLCQHNHITASLPKAEFPTIERLAQRWQEEETAMRGYLAGLSNDDLAGIVRYTTETGQQRERVLWHCLLHVVNHGTQHRSEAAAILTRYGHSPGELDFTVFLNEQG